MDSIGLYSTTVTYLASKEIEIGEKTRNKGYYAVQGHPRSSKVIEVGTNRKPVCDFLLVIMELFSLGVTAEALRAKID